MFCIQFCFVASRPDGDPLLFDLPVGPEGMSVHPVTGVVTWTPQGAQAGDHAVLLRVKDGEHGGVALLSFTVSVAPANHRPFVVSLPQQGPVELGMTYRYQMRALDPDQGDALTYSKLSPTPAGVAVDPATGVVTWDPQASGAPAVTYTFSLQAADPGGLTAVQTFTVEVGGANTDRPPVIVSTPRTVTGVGREYLYPVRAVDPDGSPFTLSLVAAPAGMTLVGGLVRWTPAAPGDYTVKVKVKVSDGKYHVTQGNPDDEYRHTQTFLLRVLADAPPNRAPVIVSTPPRYADIDSVFRYDVLAADPDDDFVRYALVGEAPDGVVLDAETGALRWRPAAWQAGNQSITVRAMDRFGAYVDHTFTVLVRLGNRPPLITSTPPAEAEVGQPFFYPVRVEDPDGDAVSLALTGSVPPGLTIVDGLVKGTPAAAGTYTFTVRAEDARGAVAEQPVTLVVSPVLNWPPVLTSDPALDTVTGASYSYQAVATDPDGDGLTYGVTTSPGVSLSVSATGLVSWAVPANYVAAGQTANVQVTLRVTDDGSPSRFAEQSYTLVVRGNRAPTLGAVASQAVTAGNPFRLDLQGADADGDALSYALAGRNGTAVPPSLSVDGLGRVRWEGTLAGNYEFTATVTDPYGLSASRDFTLTVSPDTAAPAVHLQVQDDPASLNQSARFKVDASDDVGVTQRKLEVSLDGGLTWETVGLDSDGVGRRTFTQAMVVKLRASARNAAGNEGTVTRDLTVLDPAASGPPVVAITAPGSNAKVTTLSTVTGTVTDDDGLLSWKLEYAPDGGNSWTLLKQVTGGLGTSVNVSEAFDPTLLPNGMYLLRLSATDTGGHTGSATRTIMVDGRLKLGNLTFSATDLTIPVAGIPITIGRTYDTLDADEVGDFGFGWKLSLGGYSATVDQATTAPAFLNGSPTFKDGTRVYVKRPDGGIDGYTFTPIPASVLFGNVLSWYPYFSPDVGVLNELRDRADGLHWLHRYPPPLPGDLPPRAAGAAEAHRPLRALSRASRP